MSQLSPFFQEIIIKNDNKIRLFIYRADLNHPFVSGNKLWKLKFNLLKAKQLEAKTIITFGGAYSNHIYSTAFAGMQNGFESVGLIRGEELANTTLNSTLQQAQKWGMKFYFLPRSDYRLKENSEAIQEILSQYSNYYLIPEGGTNALAIAGVQEIVDNQFEKFNIIASSVGTGGTLAGLSMGAHHQQIIGFPALKNASFLKNEIQKYSSKNNFQLDLRYHFGGYGKYNDELLQFIQSFYQKNSIPLDLIYTGKMMYGLIKNIENNEYPKGSKIVAVHTGGLQGNKDTIQFK